MLNVAELAILIKARDEASRVLAKVSFSAQGVADKIGTGLKMAGVIGAAGLGAVAVAARGFIKDAMQSQQIAAQTEAVIKSTGGTAGVSADQVAKLATNLSLVTPFDDEVIQSAQNVLLTFTAINKDIFPRTTELVLDISQALGQDLQSSAVQVGKALQDPVNGITALRRAGVNFSDDQQKVIKALVDTGQTAKAQNLILDELQREFGGSARAAGDTFAGKMAILNTQLGNVRETIGMALIPVLTVLATKLAGFLAGHQDDIQRFAELFSVKVVQAISELIAAFERARPTLESIIGTMRTGFETIRPGLQWVLDNKIALAVAFTTIGVAAVLALTPITLPILAVVAALGALLYVIGIVRQHWDQITRAVDDHRKLILILLAVLFPIPLLLAAIGVAIAKLVQNWGDVKRAVTEFVTSALDRVAFLRDAVEFGFAFMIAVARFAWATIRNDVETAINAIRDVVRIVMAVIHGDWGEAWAGLKALVGDVWEGIKDGIANDADFVRAILRLTWALITNEARDAWTMFRDAISHLAYVAGQAIIEALKNGIDSVVSSLLGKLDDIRDKITSALNPKNWVGSPRGLQNWLPYYFEQGLENLRGVINTNEVMRQIAAPASLLPMHVPQGTARIDGQTSGGTRIQHIYIDQVVISGDPEAGLAALGL